MGESGCITKPHPPKTEVTVMLVLYPTDSVAYPLFALALSARYFQERPFQ